MQDLKNLEFEISKLDRLAREALELEKNLAAIRNGERPLMVWLNESATCNSTARSAIEDVINEFSLDLLRVVEMRQAALARSQKIAANHKRAQLATVVIVTYPAS